MGGHQMRGIDLPALPVFPVRGGGSELHAVVVAGAQLLLGLLMPSPLLAGAAPGAAPPTGQAALLPVEVEAVRSRYGQEALFRLRLGADAGRDPTAGAALPCPAVSAVWSGSAEERQFQQQLSASRPYAAGLILGTWQRCHPGFP